MRAVVQRVKKAAVEVKGQVTGSIEQGLLVLLGISQRDTASDLRYLAEKVVNLRIFPDENDKMNRSVQEIGGGVLVVSQFTLYGDCRKGRRPSYNDAAPPERARQLYEEFAQAIAAQGLPVATGRFQADMQVELVNDGPVTILLDSEKGF